MTSKQNNIYCLIYHERVIFSIGLLYLFRIILNLSGLLINYIMLPLKEATAVKHKQAERMPFNVRMFKGLLSKNEYLLYLDQQLQIFHTVESTGLPHVSLKRAENFRQTLMN